MSRKKLLITGGSGFIFSNFIRSAIHHQLPYEIVNVDYCKNPVPLRNVYVNPNCRLYIGSVCDRHFLNVVFEKEKPEIVVHAAASTFVDEAIENPSQFVEDNVTGTQAVIDTCLKWGVEKLVYTNTDEVHGQLQSESEPSWTEESPLNPRNPYSASKAAGELLIKAAHETYNLQYNIIRSCNNYGPRQRVRNLIPKIISKIYHNEKIPIYGQGKQLREWLYVDDFYTAFSTILEKARPNEIYNISSNNEFSNLEVVHEICKIMEKGENLIEFVKDRLAHDFRYSLNSNKLRELGWKPGFKLRDGLKLTVNWYLKNYNYLKE